MSLTEVFEVAAAATAVAIVKHASRYFLNHCGLIP